MLSHTFHFHGIVIQEDKGLTSFFGIFTLGFSGFLSDLFWTTKKSRCAFWIVPCLWCCNRKSSHIYSHILNIIIEWIYIYTLPISRNTTHLCSLQPSGECDLHQTKMTQGSGCSLATFWSKKILLLMAEIQRFCFLAKLSIFHQPGFPWNKGISLNHHFGLRSCEVAYINSSTSHFSTTWMTHDVGQIAGCFQ